MMAASIVDAVEDQSASGIRAVHLRCEYLVNPVGSDAREPRLNWQVEAVDESARGVVQSAWQVIVASSAEKLAADEGDLWDSGQVIGAETLHHRYAGAPLNSGMAAYWKVRVWDGNGAASAWSETATWSMGLLEEADWEAQWIGLPRDEDPKYFEGPEPVIPPSPLLRREFSVDAPVTRATLYATARGLYECRLNGERVGDQHLAPEWTDYNKRIQYQAYDVTEHIREGVNALGATLGDGWYLGRMGPTRWDKDYPRRGVYGKHRRLLVRLEIERADGTKQIIVSDGDWKVNADGPIRMSDLFLGETYDARKLPAGWDAPGFDDSAWASVVAEPLDGVPLEAQMNEPIRVVAELPAQSVSEPAPGVYIFDLGQNMAGICRVRLTGQPGQEITLRHGEMLNEEDGTLYVTNLAAAIQTDRFICAGGGEEVFEPAFTYHGFRYVEVTGLKENPAPSMITGLVLASDTPVAITFECSNPMLNKLAQNALWTQRGNMHSVPTDCPQRDERMGWMGDAQVFSQSSIFNMDMAAFYTKWIQDIRDAQAKDGSFPDIAPHSYGPDERFKNAPGWGDAGVVVPWRVYQNYGDVEVLREHIDAAKRFIDGIHRDNPNLIWVKNTGNNYGDWLSGDTIKAEGYPSKGAEFRKDAYATAFFAHSTSLLARMCAVLGMDDDAKRYEKLAADITAVFQEKYVKDSGRISGDTQAGYALALHFELLPEAVQEAAAEHMVEAIAAYDGRISTGFQSTYRMMLELTRWGYNDLAYQLVESTRFPSWGYSIEQGATTIWERWDGYVKGRGFQDPGMNSFNHYAIGAVVEWMYRTIGGINLGNDHSAWADFEIEPRPGGTLTWARTRYASVRGDIETSWKIEDGQFLLAVTVPANTTATIGIPTPDEGEVREGDLSAMESPGVTLLEADTEVTRFRVGSGRYVFTVPYSRAARR
jgi:alpha-L-rhamnosidase